jgi:hypothetical protein
VKGVGCVAAAARMLTFVSVESLLREFDKKRKTIAVAAIATSATVTTTPVEYERLSG